MIGRLKDAIKRRWPPLRLRTILFATLFLVAALPGISAVFLRVYENTLVRQTEAELIAQGSALVATARAVWPGAPPLAAPDEQDYHPELPRIDLNATPILGVRPQGVADGGTVRADARAAAERLVPVFAVTGQTTAASLTLIDANGRVVNGAEAGRSYAALPEVRAALAGRSDTVLRRRGNYRPVYALEWLSRAAAIRIDHTRPIIVEGRVVGVLLLSRSARTLFKGLYDDRSKIALGILLILITLIVLSGLISRGIARPIEALGAATRELANGRGTVPEPSRTAAIEIQGLYRDFAAMAEAIDRRSRYLRDFAHAMSHEFKTPLAGIRGAIELLEDHDETMSPEERRRFLANADAGAERLSALVTRLLELARADMTRHDMAAATPLSAVLARVANAMGSDAFRMTVALPEPVNVAMPEDTIEAIVTTLAENSRQAGAHELRITGARQGERVILTLCDDGPGIAPADRERIFEPFFTTRRPEGGTGLGLSIVASLVEASGGSIRLGEAEAGGACFVLELSVATTPAPPRSG